MFEPRNRSRYRIAARIAVSSLLALALCYVLVLMPLPYYIFQPGSAEPVGPMIEMKQDGYPEKGAFLLTTVSVSRTNVLNYMYARLRAYEIRPQTDVRKAGETDKEYNQRQEYVMLDSQSSAIQAAYRKAGVPYRIVDVGVTVLRTMPGMPAHGVLEPGDYVTELDGKPVKRSADVFSSLENRKAGDEVRIGYKRGETVRTATLKLAMLPREEGQTKERAGIGFEPADVQTVRAEQEEKQVAVKAGEIGGPSAGFMFAMEIYNRLTPEDITKGYRIAGTGTIDAEGHIGVIGGIRHKVVAASREKADFFFAPKDWYPPAGEPSEPVKNASDAADQAQKIGSRMKVVPVATMDEALAYLAKLPPKQP